MMYAGTLGDVTRGRTFEAVFGKCLDRGVKQLLLRHDASLLLFARPFWRDRGLICDQGWFSFGVLNDSD